tara:strand:- start:154 stop:504 length:351 start_codon:yes stop_codon:yes gene_type:complete
MSISIWQIIIILVIIPLSLGFIYGVYLLGTLIANKSNFVKTKINLPQLILLNLIFFMLLRMNPVGEPALAYVLGGLISAIIGNYIHKLRKKAKMFDKSFFYGWFGLSLLQILTVWL